jgi:hypothetical protein
MKKKKIKTKVKVRANAPTAGVIATSTASYGTAVSVPNETWTLVMTFTVPDVDHEAFFLYASAEIVTSPDTDYLLSGRIYDSTDGIYYPINDVTNNLQEPCWMPNVTMMSGVFFFTIPKNVKGHTLYFQIRHAGIGGTCSFIGRVTGWGHSCHTHR